MFNSYKDFLLSPAWEALRSAALIYAGNCCQICNSKKHLNVHHRHYNNAWGQEKLNDLTVLCRKCHAKFHGIGSKPNKKSYQKQPRAFKKRKQKQEKKYDAFNSSGYCFTFRTYDVDKWLKNNEGYHVKKSLINNKQAIFRK